MGPRGPIYGNLTLYSGVHNDDVIKKVRKCLNECKFLRIFLEPKLYPNTGQKPDVMAKGKEEKNIANSDGGTF